MHGKHAFQKRTLKKKKINPCDPQHNLTCRFNELGIG